MDDRLALAISHISNLVSFDTSPEKCTKDIVNYIAKIFHENGIKYEISPFGDKGEHAVIVAKMGPDKNGGVIFSGHMDVVNVRDQNWKYLPFQVTENSNRLYGRGTCDMKGFIGSVLALIPHWKNIELEYPLYFAFSCDEETDVLSINNVINLINTHDKPDMAIVGEPTDMKVVSGHKGGYELALDIIGKGCHSSRPELGVDANIIATKIVGYIYERAEAVRQIHFDKSFDPPYPIICVPIFSGGNAANKISEKATILFHMRPTDNKQIESEKNHLEEFVAKICKEYGASYVLTENLNMPALSNSYSSFVNNFMNKLGLEVNNLTAPFWTESGYLQKAGIPTVVCGPGNIAQAHAADEFVEISQIEECLKVFSNLPKKMP